MATTRLADRLLDAQVAWVMAELADDRIEAVIARDVDAVLDLAARVPLDQVVTAEDLSRIIRWVLAVVPPSTTASTMVQAWAEVVHAGPEQPYTPSDLIDRAHVEALLDEALARTPSLGRRLDRLADAPAVGAVASRFISRIVVDVLQANQRAAERIPGMGSIMSFGTSAASKVIGAAEKPLQVVGDTAGKGAAYAVRRLNAVVVDTLQDPTLRQAVLEVWDRMADEPIGGLESDLSAEDAQRIAGLLQDVAIGVVASAPAEAMVDAFVDAFMGIYGPHPVGVLVEELGISRQELAAEAQAVLPPLVAAARADGALEAAVRERLAPFFASPEVRALLGGAPPPPR